MPRPLLPLAGAPNFSPQWIDQQPSGEKSPRMRLGTSCYCRTLPKMPFTQT